MHVLTASKETGCLICVLQLIVTLVKLVLTACIRVRLSGVLSALVSFIAYFKHSIRDTNCSITVDYKNAVT